MTLANEEMKRFFRDGVEALQSGKCQPFAVEVGSEEWRMWEAYLSQRCGSLPVTMLMAIRGEIGSWTAPAQWPEWFDGRYVAPAEAPPANYGSRRPLAEIIREDDAREAAVDVKFPGAIKDLEAHLRSQGKGRVR